ncbi:MAG: TetR/AcrR family transcriptional regulator [Arthrobacter sp.]
MSPASDTRTQVLDAFAARMAEYGYLGTAMVEVGRAADIRRPSIYHHFPNGKEEVFTQVALRFIDKEHARIKAALETRPALRDKLAALVEVSADSDSRLSLEQRIYEALNHVSLETRELVSSRYVQDLLSPVSDLFSEAIAQGELRGEPGFLANAFLSLAKAIDVTDAPDAVTRIVDLFMNGAGPAVRS